MSPPFVFDPSVARIVAYRDSFPLSRDLRQARLASHKGMISRKGTMSLREPHMGVILQSATGEELGALLSSVLDKAFKGEP